MDVSVIVRRTHRCHARCRQTAVLGKVVLPALVSPLLAGVVAPDGGDRRCTRILDRDHRHCRGLGRRARWRVEHTRAHEGTLRLAVGPRLHPQWTSEAHAFSPSVATAIRHPGRCPAERQSWLSRHLVQNQSSSRRTAADEAGWRMRPAVIIAWTPPRVSSTSGSCGPILTAPSTWCAPVTALDGSDVTSGWGVAATSVTVPRCLIRRAPTATCVARSRADHPHLRRVVTRRYPFTRLLLREAGRARGAERSLSCPTWSSSARSR